MKHSLSVCCTLLLTSIVTAGCGGGTTGRFGGTEQQQTTATAEAPESTESGGETENTNDSQSAQTVTGSEVPLSIEYGVSTSINRNLLSVADSGTAVAAWVTETNDNYSLTATIEAADGWQSATALSKSGVVSVVSAGSAQTVMLAWQQRAFNSVNFSNSEIRTRLLLPNGWSDIVIAGSPASEETTRLVSDLAIAAMPDDRFALVWSEREISQAGTQQLLSIWQGGQWSVPQPLATVGPYVVDNHLISTPNGDLSYFHSESVESANGAPLTGFFLRDQMALHWQTAVRIDDVAIPLWLRRVGQGNFAVANSAGGRQLVAWSITLRDSFGTLYYAIASRQRAGHGLRWSDAHFELVGNESASQVKAAINDTGNAVIGWRQDLDREGDFTPDETLSLARLTTDGGWLTVETNLLQPAHFQDLPGERAVVGLSGDDFVLGTVDNNLRVSVIVDVFDQAANSFYAAMYSGRIGFEQQPVIAGYEISRALDERLLSCAANNGSYRCSRKVGKYNFVLNSERLFTEQIRVIDVAEQP